MDSEQVTKINLKALRELAEDVERLPGDAVLHYLTGLGCRAVPLQRPHVMALRELCMRSVLSTGVQRGCLPRVLGNQVTALHARQVNQREEVRNLRRSAAYLNTERVELHNKVFVPRLSSN
ncbi:hypothetical protein PPYR_00270 [Photinus pyralis]|uniref:Uncharacterized protein n=1 Tax=Photinus pyralis TaxID=7054 RepID=A0A5N4B1N4_PHOPY|nr:hypothetical protein PPYR_00270 [Photinus pyralis]